MSILLRFLYVLCCQGSVRACQRDSDQFPAAIPDFRLLLVFEWTSPVWYRGRARVPGTKLVELGVVERDRTPGRYSLRA